MAEWTKKWTRSSADADKPERRIWRSVKVTKYNTIHILGTVSYCTIVTLSLRQYNTFLRYSTSKNVVTLKWGQRSLKVIESDLIW